MVSAIRLNWYSAVRDAAYFLIDSLVNIYMDRWKRYKSNRATDSKTGERNYAINGKQRWRCDEYVFQEP
jgi:hypothetical protein